MFTRCFSANQNAVSLQKICILLCDWLTFDMSELSHARGTCQPGPIDLSSSQNYDTFQPSPLVTVYNQVLQTANKLPDIHVANSFCQSVRHYCVITASSLNFTSLRCESTSSYISFSQINCANNLVMTISYKLLQTTVSMELFLFI